MTGHVPFDATTDWANPYCGNTSNDPLVDKLIGNAYHVVRTVYCNLGNLKLLYDYLTTHGMVVGVQSEVELKALPKQFAKFARIYNFASTGDRQVTDYLYVDDDASGIKPDDPTLTGSWIKVAVSGSAGGGEGGGEGAYIPYVYQNGSATGGETSFKVPEGTVGVPFLIINGSVQYVGYGFTYDPSTATVTLSNPLTQGDEVVALTTAVPANPDNPDISGWIQVNWLYNNGSAMGGEQVITIPYNFADVPAVYKNGERLFKGLPTESYTVDKSNRTITMTEILAQGDRIIVTLGGESAVLTPTDRTLQEVARSTNVKDDDVVLSNNVNVVITSKKVIYDVVAQKSYGLPNLPPNAYIVSVSDGKLTYNPGGVVVDLLDVPNSAQDNLDAFEESLASTTGERLIGICPTIAVLRTTEPVTDGQRITVKEYASSTGKGGGQFRAVLNGSTYTDDKGTVIKTAGGAAWLRINADVVNPLMFGALGNGQADDQQALTLSFRAATRKCDGLGLTYMIGATIQQDKNTPTLFENANINFLPALGTNPMMRIKNAAHTLRGVTFDGGGSTTNPCIIWEGANTGDGGLIENCLFKYIGGPAINISGDYTNRIFARFGAIRNCRFIKCGNTGVANGRCTVIADGVSNFTFDGLYMTECNWGLYVRMDTQLADKARAPNNLIQNCRIFGSGQNHPTFVDAQGLSANRQDSLKVDNCWIGDFRDNGFDCGSSTGTQITNFRVNNCKDAIFIGDIDCDSYVIDNVVARDCERGVRIVMDGNIQSNGVVRNVRITNMLVTNPKYQGLYIGNTGANTGVFDIYLANVYVDSVSSWSLSSYTRPFHIEGIDGIFMDNCGTRYAKTNSVYFKKCDQAQLRGGRFQESDQSGGGTYAITVENDCARVSISDAIVYGKSTTGAVLLAGGAGHSVKHVRWRSAANGVSSSSATTPYLLDNASF